MGGRKETKLNWCGREGKAKSSGLSEQSLQIAKWFVSPSSPFICSGVPWVSAGGNT